MCLCSKQSLHISMQQSFQIFSNLCKRSHQYLLAHFAPWGESTGFMTSFAGQQIMAFSELRQKFISTVQFPHFSTEHHVSKSAVEASLLLHKDTV